MKNNSFRFLHLFLVACSLVLVITTFKSGDEQTNSRGPTSLPRPAKKQHRLTPRAPMKKLVRGPASLRPYNKFAIARRVKVSTDIRMNAGHVFAENIGALPLSDWKPGMSPLIFDDGKYGYYEKRKNDASIPVAYNPALRTLSPISSIIHLKGVDEATREKLKQAGYQESYYFKNIQRLSLRSSGNVIQDYEELKKQGLKVRLEVIHEGPELH